ncbi:MAG: hypothetical protein AB1490_02745 [Pseudomonadota bacterium]
MMLFVLAAVMVAIGHLVVAAQRPRLALFVSGALWVLYAVYEYHIANGTLCDKDCNIRVDLVFFLPILAVATVMAYQAHLRPAGQPTAVGWALGAGGLAVVAMASEAVGYTAPAVAVGVCALALGGYAIKLRFAAGQASSIS